MVAKASLDWDSIRLFLQVAQSGSLSKAALQLDLSQPTLSRQIQQLELDTGVQLFQRSTRGLHITEQGARLLHSAQAMESAAESFARQVSGMEEEELSGDVRISVGELLGVYYLPQAIAAFQLQHPRVNVEIVISNQASSLSKREADIALRMFRPQQSDLVCRRLPDVELGFFAAQDYIKQDPDSIGFEQLGDYRFVGYDNDTTLIEGARSLGVELSRDDFSLRCDSVMMQLALIKAGAGFGISYVHLMQSTPGMVRLLKHIPLQPLELWCACHRDVQLNLRVRTAMRFFGDWFYRQLSY